MTGKKLTEKEGEEFGLEVMRKLNEYTAKWKAAENMDYSLYGTPLESTTYKFAKCLQKRFGIIPGVTDKSYITNSYHVHVSEEIDAFTKLKFESEFQQLSPGGAISYVEVPNMQNNIPAVLSVMKFIYENAVSIVKEQPGMIAMWAIGAVLIFLAIKFDMEPTLLLPMGFGAILVNLPFSGAVETLETLFGKGATLTNKKDLSQPGQYACEERITVVGPKNSLVCTILGPTRPADQVEISATDARSIGVAGVIRESGDVAGTPGCKLVGTCGEVEIAEGVIVAKRHIHMTPADAEKLGVEDKEIVSVKAESADRSCIYEDVVVRVHDNFALAMHIDTDESNAAFGVREGYIVK